MAIQDKNTLKTYFETGDAPSQNQFADLIDSLKHENNIPFANFSDREIIIMANRLSAMKKAFIEYDITIGDSIVRLEVIQKNAENQVIEITETKDQARKQYFIGDTPYTIRLKELQVEKLRYNDYYSLGYQVDQSYYGVQRLFGNTLPDIPEGFDFGAVDKYIYFQISKQNYGQAINIVNTNTQFVNKTGISIEYRIQSSNWSDIYRKEDTVTDHYDLWDYLYFFYKADMTNETDTIVCNVYNQDIKKLVATTTLTSGQYNQNVWGGNTVYQARNILIECIKQ